MPLYGEKKKRYQVEWLAKRRLDWINSRGGKCEKCAAGGPFHIDHVDPSTKELPISYIWSKSEAIRNPELAKCQVLCVECHRAKTKQEQTVEYPHGTYARYKSKGCRCWLCKETVAPYWREYRARIKAQGS